MPKRRSLSASLFALAIAACVMAGCAWLVFRTSLATSRDDIRAGAQQRLDLYAAGLDSEIGRFSRLPGILALSPAVTAVLHDPGNAAGRLEANRYLEGVAGQTDASAIYVIAPDGTVIVSSNWRDAGSFVGENDGFRAYFQEAMQGRQSRFFGVGTTRSEPGYYLSRALYDGQRKIGVAVVKISLAPLETTWRQSGALVWVADANRVLILASRPEWRLATLGALSPDALLRFTATRQYNRLPLRPLPIVGLGPGLAERIVRWRDPSADDAHHPYLLLTRPLPHSDWTLSAMASLAPAYSLALARAGLSAVLNALILTGLVLWHERRRRQRERLTAAEALRRAYQELEHKVVLRTAKLTKANRQLTEEIAERSRAEAHLHQTQAELMQAGKLAAIGQLSTMVAHELNQPLAALRTLSGNTVKYLARGDLDTASTNLDTIARLVERMGEITGALRSFARKPDGLAVNADVAQILGHALLLFEPRFSDGRIAFIRLLPETPLVVACDPNRLEQLFVNLLSNALDAVRDVDGARIAFSAEALPDGHVRITVHDNGPGLSAHTLAHAFDPFFTTKPAGAGLGLGLALSSTIAREAGGTLEAGNHADGGAIFTLTLPMPAEEPDHG
jgi:two-component system C4-dicarboxylate transport sensor histidine kinase DctB